MAMIPGNVTVNPTTAAVSGTGLARELFDARIAVIDFQGLDQPGKEVSYARILQQLADQANADAPVIIAHVQNNAVVSATSTIQAGSQAIGVTTGGSNVTVQGTAATSDGTIA